MRPVAVALLEAGRDIFYLTSQLDEISNLINLPGKISTADLAQFQRIFQILSDRHMGPDGVRLKNEAKVARFGPDKITAQRASDGHVRPRSARFKPHKPNPRQPISDHKLHLRIAQIVLHLKDQHREHPNGGEPRSASLGSIPALQTLNEPLPKILKVHLGRQDLNLIAVLTQAFKMIGKAEKTAGIHDRKPPAISESQKINQR